MDFKYTHHDGRTGTGWSEWTAIVNAITIIEAAKLPLLNVFTWKIDKKTNEYKPLQIIAEGTSLKIGKLSRTSKKD